jgi:NitT/TauT family transport system permease protein
MAKPVNASTASIADEADTAAIRAPRPGGLRALAWAGRGLGQIYSVLLLLLLWEGLALLIQDPLFLPRFTAVLGTEWALLRSGELVRDISVSMSRALTGFALAVVIGVPLGILMGWSRRWDQFWNLIISFTNPLPKIGLVPLFILWLGIGEPSKFAVIAAGAVFPIVINTYNGVRGVNRLWVWRASTMGASQAEVLLKVVLPAALPQILAGARLGMALSWVILLAAEMVASRSGLGFRILYGQQMFNTQVVFAGLLTIAVFGFVFDRLILALSYRFCGWYFRLGNEPGTAGT